MVWSILEYASAVCDLYITKGTVRIDQVHKELHGL